MSQDLRFVDFCAAYFSGFLSINQCPGRCQNSQEIERLLSCLLKFMSLNSIQDIVIVKEKCVIFSASSNDSHLIVYFGWTWLEVNVLSSWSDWAIFNVMWQLLLVVQTTYYHLLCNAYGGLLGFSIGILIYTIGATCKILAWVQDK